MSRFWGLAFQGLTPLRLPMYGLYCSSFLYQWHEIGFMPLARLTLDGCQPREYGKAASKVNLRV